MNYRTFVFSILLAVPVHRQAGFAAEQVSNGC